MMGTLAAVLAGKKIFTSKDLYWAEVEGIIENANNILKITQILVKYHLKVPQEKVGEARGAFSSYIDGCPTTQSVIGFYNYFPPLKCYNSRGYILITRAKVMHI